MGRELFRTDCGGGRLVFSRPAAGNRTGGPKLPPVAPYAGNPFLGATPTARRGRVFERQTDSHAHAKPWAWHPT
jgi:hypothetical protein